MPTTGDVTELLSCHALQRIADAGSFDRGKGYFSAGHVTEFLEKDGELLATVLGSETYYVRLFSDGGELDGECTCPIGVEGAFCKHCVAAGLAWLAASKAPGKKPKARSEVGVSMKEVRAWLQKRQKEELVEMIVEQAGRDAALRQDLVLRAAHGAGKRAALAVVRATVDRATRVPGYMGYREARGFAAGISRVVASIESLLDERAADDVIELTEYALGKVEQAAVQIDDSDGQMGDILSRLQDIHLAACDKAKPEPVALARRLFKWEMTSEFDTFYGAIDTYAQLLGERGLAAYRKCAEAEWAKVPELGPGDSDPAQYGSLSRIRNIMENLARQSGDVDALARVMMRDLSQSHTFLGIAKLYQEAKRDDEALAWAERGLKAFPDQVNSEVGDYLAGEYHRRKRHDDAMRIAWSQFESGMALEHYQKLKQNAALAAQWPAWREKALSFIRAEIAREKRASAKQTRWGWPFESDHSLLVQIFLWENDGESAWREAQLGGCGDWLWLEAAKAREETHPADTIPLYRAHVERLINQKANGAYEEAVALLRRLRRLMPRVPGQDFPAYVAALRAAHKPKRNFMKLSEGLERAVAEPER